MSAFGRQNIGYYELKGRPLNAYAKSSQAFRANKDLSELFSIIQNEEYEYIGLATDQDLDGFLIRGSLLGFFFKYLPEYLKQGRIGMLQTPIMAEMKNDIPTKWVYDVNDSHKLKGSVKYFKGLGTWSKKALQTVYKKDTLEKMFEIFEFDQKALDRIDTWLNSKRADDRKEKILENEFDLIKL